MSPSEFDLRAALHHGEGDAPDAGALIAHAVHVRRERRRRITSAVSGAAVVAVVAVGVSLLVRGGGNDSAGPGADAAGGTAGGSTFSTQRSAGGPNAGTAELPSGGTAGGTGIPAGGNAGTLPGLTCPASPTQYMLPGGGGTDQFGASGQLFARPIGHLMVCLYSPRPGAAPRSLVLDTQQARQFADALESAPATGGLPACSPNVDALGGQAELLAVDPAGTKLRPVVLTLQCGGAKVTNGTAVRYVTDVPQWLMQAIADRNLELPKRPTVHPAGTSSSSR